MLRRARRIARAIGGEGLGVLRRNMSADPAVPRIDRALRAHHALRKCRITVGVDAAQPVRLALRRSRPAKACTRRSRAARRTRWQSRFLVALRERSRVLARAFSALSRRLPRRTNNQAEARWIFFMQCTQRVAAGCVRPPQWGQGVRSISSSGSVAARRARRVASLRRARPCVVGSIGRPSRRGGSRRRARCRTTRPPSKCCSSPSEMRRKPGADATTLGTKPSSNLRFISEGIPASREPRRSRPLHEKSDTLALRRARSAHR